MNRLSQGLSSVLLVILIVPGFVLTAPLMQSVVAFQPGLSQFGPSVNGPTDTFVLNSVSSYAISDTRSSVDYEIDVLTPEEPTRMYDSASLTPHGAISIYQEAHWISQGWPGSGIESDPYRIENLYIDTSSISEDAILVANTEVHFVISNCTVIAKSDHFGIRMRDIKNGLVQNCTVSGGVGIYLDVGWDYGDTTWDSFDTRDITLFNNTCASVGEVIFGPNGWGGRIFDTGHGIISAGARYNTIINNTCTSINSWFGHGITLYESQDMVVANNTCIRTADSDPWNYGIRLLNSNNNNVTDNTVTVYDADQAYTYGIHLDNSHNNIISRNSCGGTNGFVDTGGYTDHSIYITYSNYTEISNNIISGKDNGLYLIYCEHNNITGNTVFGNDYGINFQYCDSIIVIGNECYTNSVSGIYDRASDNVEIYSNIVHSNTRGIHSMDLPSDIYYNLCFSNTYGVVISNTIAARVFQNNCTSNDQGIVIENSDGCYIYNNNCSTNTADGISLSNSDGCSIYDNNLVNNVDYDILLWESSNNEIFNNYCESDNVGIGLGGGSASVRSDSNVISDNVCVGHITGIYLHFAYYNNVTRNQCSSISFGVYLYTGAQRNRATYNVVTGSTWGFLTYGFDNTIEQNIVRAADYAIACGGTSVANVLRFNTLSNSSLWNAYDSGTSNTFAYNYYDDYTGSDSNDDNIGDDPWPVVAPYPTITNWDPTPLMFSPQLPIWLTPPVDQTLEYHYQELSQYVEAYAPADFSYLLFFTYPISGLFVLYQTGLLTNSTALPLGSYNFTVAAQNIYGFSLTTLIRIDCVDTTDPTWDEQPTNQVMELGDAFSYSVSASDIHGVSSWWISDTSNFSISSSGEITNNVALILDSYPLEIHGYDISGNFCNSTILVTVEDTTDPTWDELPLGQIIELGNSFSYEVNASDLDGIDSYWLSDAVNFTITSEGLVANNVQLIRGVYSLEMRAYDRSGQYCTVTISVTVEDTTNPEWDEVPSDLVIDLGSALSYDLNATDLDSIDNWWVSDEGNFSISSTGVVTNDVQLELGLYYLEVRAYDWSGQYCSASLVFIVEDNTAPTWDVTPTNQILEFGDTFAYDVSASDLGSFAYYWLNDTTYFSIDASGLIEHKGSVPVGTHSLEVRAYDDVGLYCSAMITITVLDSTAPIWTLSPSDQSSELGLEITFHVSAADISGIHHYWLDDTTYFTIDGSGSVTGVGLVPVGSHDIEVRAYDSFDNYCTFDITITVEDTTSPEWVADPVNQLLAYGDTLSYQLQVTDLSNLGSWSLNDTVHFSIDSGLISNNTELEARRYGLTVSAEDIYGNTITDSFYVYVLPADVITTTLPTTTPTDPTGLGPMILILGVVGVGGVAVVILLVVFVMKRKTTT